MAEASQGRVTITLGRSGQVVKRAGHASDVRFADSLPLGGSRRSATDRLGGNVNSSLLCGSQLNNKRKRGESRTASLNSNGFNDAHIGKDDLRYKLMQKNFSQTQSHDDQKVMDLHEKLSKIEQPPLKIYEARRRMYDSRERYPNPMERMPESRETSILSRIPSTRSADDVPHLISSRNSYSPWTLDHLRQRSPNRVMGTPRGISPPRNVEELHRRPLSRTYDDMRTPVQYMGKDILEAPRPVTSSFLTKPTLPTTSVNPMPPGPPIPSAIPPPVIVQKSLFAVDEQQTVEGLLHTLGLGKYALSFKAEEVDMTALKQMGENDLKELGIPMGPRKKILLALLSRSRRQQ